MIDMKSSATSPPRLSVILPVYNAEDTLERVLACLRHSKEESLEILCVNDGSKDKSGAILQKIAREDARFIVIEQENQGVSAARNAALKACSGEYVIFVDADDEVTADYFSNLLLEAEANRADLVVCGFSTSLPNEELQLKRYVGEVYDMPPPALLASLPAGVCSHLYKREILASKDVIAQFPPGVRYGEDTAFHFAVYPEIRKLVISAECGYIIHETPGSATDRASQLVADMPNALKWLGGVYQNLGYTKESLDFLVLFAAHTMQRLYALSTRQTISANLAKLREAVLYCGIQEEMLRVLSAKRAAGLRSILRGNVRPPLSYYIKSFRKKLKR